MTQATSLQPLPPMVSKTAQWLTSFALVLGAFITIYILAKTTSTPFKFHMIIMLVAFLAGIVGIMNMGFYKKGRIEAKPSASGVFYNEGVIKAGVIASLFWGVAGFLAGDTLAWQLTFPALNFDTAWFNFGRLRPLHTSAVIFAFGGNVLMMTSFYVVQRTCKARLAGEIAPWFVFWGYQLFIVLAATGYLLGITQSKEYAEPEWYVDIWLTIVWVTYLFVFVGTLWRRKEPHIYVANWFFLAFIVTVAMLHLINNMAVPISFTHPKSVIIFAGVQDALIQWWYGHNAVGFFLTAGFLGIMYYFIPKRVNRPVYSYRLSIVHFWSLIFLYIWAGPHHLLYTALPDWAQTLGMTFSIMLWMPSWGGMINGLMTLSGAWDKLRTDPVVKMLVASVAFYGMSTFEGPLMAIKAVNGLSHYTDWTVGHVHSGALGWVAFVSFGAIYCLVPWLWGRKELYSLKLVSLHFWIATLGIILYITSMWASGIMEGMMWRAFDSLGFLQYSFVEIVDKKFYLNGLRAVGGLMFVIGAFIMVYNVWRTILGHGDAVPINHKEAHSDDNDDVIAEDKPEIKLA